MSLPDPEKLGLPGLGGRLSLVGQLPTTVAALVILAITLSGAPGNSPSWARLTAAVSELTAEEIGWLAAGVLVLTILLHPLQQSMVRLLEGYPLLHGIGSAVGRPLLWLWRRKFERLDKAQRVEGTVDARTAEAIGRAAARLRRLPARDRLMPTRLGNTLRAAEDEARQLYGIETVVIWPLLYPLVSDPLSAGLKDARDRLDLEARFSCTFAVTAVLSAILLSRTLWWVPVAAVLLFLGALSYRAAITAAGAYGQLINTAMALHRFDLLKALHLPLPATPDAERDTYRTLLRLLRNRKVDPGLRYEHPGAGAQQRRRSPSRASRLRARRARG